MGFIFFLRDIRGDIMGEIHLKIMRDILGWGRVLDF